MEVDKKTRRAILLAVEKTNREYRKARFKYIRICAFGWIRKNWQQRKAEAKNAAKRVKERHECWLNAFIEINHPENQSLAH